MKKLLSILATIALYSTTSINLVACGSGETPNQPAQKIDLSDLPESVNVTTTATVDDYKTALITELEKEKEFNNLLETDVDITQADDNPLPTNITTGALKTKVTTKNPSTKFTGFKIITVTITTVIDLSDLPTYVKIKTTATVDDYKTALITELEKEKEFDNLLETDVEITQANGNPLPTNITTDILATKITAKKQNTKFIDSKTITVIITKVIDLSGLPEKVNVNTTPSVDAYKTALIKVLKEKKFNNLLETDVDITKDDGSVLGTQLKDIDIITGDLKTKVTAKKQNPKFTGFQIITVTITAATKVIALWADVESLAFNNNYLYAGADNGWIYKIDLTSGTKTDIINLGASVQSLAFNNNNELYAGASDQKIYKIDIVNKRSKDIINLGASVQSLAFNSNNELYAGANNNWIYKIDLTSSTATKTDIIDLEADVESLAFNNNYLYAGTSYGWIYEIDLAPATATGVIHLGASIQSLAFNNKNELYSGASRGWIDKIDLAPATATATSVIDLSSSLKSLAFNDQNELYVGTNYDWIYKLKT